MAAPNDRIDSNGYPLGFKVSQGRRGDAAEQRFTVEARCMAGHQKEAIVTEGEGCQWRLASDEGAVMKGDDLAPFPLGFFIAGVAGDLAARIEQAARRRNRTVNGVGIDMEHVFGASGSFIHSTAIATSEEARLVIRLSGPISAEDARGLMTEAMETSPAIDLLRRPMEANGFALYINGRRRTVKGLHNSPATDARDPYLIHSAPPAPLALHGRRDLLEKTGTTSNAQAPAVPLTTDGKRLLTIAGTCGTVSSGMTATETWIARDGMSRFRILAGDGAGEAPSAVALLSAGIAFCYMTQLMRYIDAQKLAIHSARLVQHTATSGATFASIDTHLFLSGSAPEEVHLNLVTIAARTCFMHAAALGSVQPNVRLELNGEAVELA